MGNQGQAFFAGILKEITYYFQVMQYLLGCLASTVAYYSRLFNLIIFKNTFGTWTLTYVSRSDCICCSMWVSIAKGSTEPICVIEPVTHMGSVIELSHCAARANLPWQKGNKKIYWQNHLQIRMKLVWHIGTVASPTWLIIQLLKS